MLPVREQLTLVLVCLSGVVCAAEPLHQRIDTLIDARGKGKPVSALAEDGEFVRRVHLDLIGSIPTSSEARKFLDDRSPDKRARLIDQLLARPEFARRMQEAFHLMFMERLGDHADWSRYLHESFAKNRPWDEMARDMLRPSVGDEKKGATFFLSKRLENYGQNPVDYPGLARDIGRLFLGKDLRCAQCHDHLFIKEYKQADFQGIFAFIQNAYLVDAASLRVGEKPLDKKSAFMSVFTKVARETGPRLPGGMEIAIPVLSKEQVYLKPPDRKTRAPGELRFSPLNELAADLPKNPNFARNIVNRMWWLMMGRGLVHPLDLHHADNPASHPDLLDLLARELIAHKYDLKWLIRELTLTRTYQRSSLLPEGATKLQPELFLTGLEKRLSAEQILWATLEATGMRASLESPPAKKASKSSKSLPDPLATIRTKFVRAFAGPVREPEEEFTPSLRGGLFLLNDPLVLDWLTPKPGNLLDRLAKLSSENAIAVELYLSVLSRRPGAEEQTEVAALLRGKTGEARIKMLSQLAWALLASSEFALNH